MIWYIDILLHIRTENATTGANFTVVKMEGHSPAEGELPGWLEGRDKQVGIKTSVSLISFKLRKGGKKARFWSVTSADSSEENTSLVKKNDLERTSGFIC